MLSRSHHRSPTDSTTTACARPTPGRSCPPKRSDACAATGGSCRSCSSTASRVNVGREQRLANRAQRRALRAIYRTCGFAGCETPFNRCEIHHLVPWEIGGVTDLGESAATVCPAPSSRARVGLAARTRPRPAAHDPTTRRHDLRHRTDPDPINPTRLLRTPRPNRTRPTTPHRAPTMLTRYPFAAHARVERHEAMTYVSMATPPALDDAQPRIRAGVLVPLARPTRAASSCAR